MRHARIAAVVLLVVAGAGCAGLTQLAHIVQPPRFEQAEGQRAEIRFVGPSGAPPAGSGWR
jgi:hypothetical protein